PRGVAARHGLHAALPPDGRRRHRRDLAHPDLALDPSRRGTRRRPHRHPRAGRAAARRRDGARRPRDRAGALRARTLFRSDRIVSPREHRAAAGGIPHPDGLQGALPDPRFPTPLTTELPLIPARSPRRKAMTPHPAQPNQTIPNPAPPGASRLGVRGRWEGIHRPYGAEDVARLRGSVTIEHTLGRMGAERRWELLNTRDYVPALGALTGGQAVQQVKAGLEAIYLSGWQVAADANLAGQTYPDQSLYPANSVPNVVRRINQALLRADQIENSESRKGVMQNGHANGHQNGHANGNGRANGNARANGNGSGDAQATEKR